MIYGNVLETGKKNKKHDNKPYSFQINTNSNLNVYYYLDMSDSAVVIQMKCVVIYYITCLSTLWFTIHS